VTAVGDLVRRIPADGEEPITLQECREAIREAHDYLVRKGTEAVGRAFEVKSTGYWGSEIKRVKVCLPKGERPSLVCPKTEEHNLVEVMNQCATIERLLDALEWSQRAGSGQSECKVGRVHPTTSSSHKDKDDHDLVLVKDSEVRAKFEVSDVASDKDGYQKEKKDLISLGVLRKGNAQEMYPAGWPEGRLFLVVSKEFAVRLCRPMRDWLKGEHPHCHYVALEPQGTTRIFEVKKGARP
jgi:hypothetical protein